MKTGWLILILIISAAGLLLTGGLTLCSGTNRSSNAEELAEAQFSVYRSVVGSFLLEGNASVKHGMTFEQSVFALPGFSHVRFIPAGANPGDQRVTFTKSYGANGQIKEEVIVTFEANRARSLRHVVTRGSAVEDTGTLSVW
jgi:hypothetical protein